MCEFVWKEDDAEQEQNVIVTRHHVLGAEIHEGDQMEPDDLLNKALVADRHRMGERIARQDRDGSYRDRKAGHERPVSPSPSVVEKPRSEEHTSELQSLMRKSYAVFRLKKKTEPNH